MWTKHNKMANSRFLSSAFLIFLHWIILEHLICNTFLLLLSINWAYNMLKSKKNMKVNIIRELASKNFIFWCLYCSMATGRKWCSDFYINICSIYPSSIFLVYSIYLFWLFLYNNNCQKNMSKRTPSLKFPLFWKIIS